ncbi:MAG: hypothetical protein HQ580_04950 [Planctomycetes bacterium]|nr:hypothetical protein [Planctomycetota bacterium]
MEIKCETLTELNSSIEQIIDGYHNANENIASLIYFDYPFGPTHERDDLLIKYASEARTCALNIFQQNPKLTEPPPPVSNPLVELQQIRQWCIKAQKIVDEIPGKSKLKNRPREQQVADTYKQWKEGGIDPKQFRAKEVAASINKNYLKDPKTGQEYKKMSEEGVIQTKIWKKYHQKKS